MLKKMLASALFAGFAAGLIAAALQLWFVQPILIKAELYESGELVHFEKAADSTIEADHAHSGHVHTSNTNHGDDNGRFDFTRDGLSILFTILIYSGYGLILVAGFAFAETKGHSTNLRNGLIWGFSGFIALQFAPAFGLPPELPGTAAAEVTPRQIWWALTVIATAVALWFVAYGKSAVHFVLAAVLILAPHIVGAPHPTNLLGTPPPELASLFASRALGVGMVAWVLLGLFAAYFWQQEEAP